MTNNKNANAEQVIIPVAAGMKIVIDGGWEPEDRGDDKATLFIAGTQSKGLTTAIGSDGNEYAVNGYVGVWKGRNKSTGKKKF